MSEDIRADVEAVFNALRHEPLWKSVRNVMTLLGHEAGQNCREDGDPELTRDEVGRWIIGQFLEVCSWRDKPIKTGTDIIVCMQAQTALTSMADDWLEVTT